MKKKTNLKFNIKPNVNAFGTYIKYLFRMLVKRPVSYIMPIVYVIYLAVIFIVVPKIMNNSPLFIWNLTTFNIPIFNLFFIAAISAALAVTVYRTSHDDGTELSISAKPLTRWQMVWSKTIVYIIVMLLSSALSIAVASLILPIFGQYSDANTTGITVSQYSSLLLSMLVGNLVTMVFFGSISIFICMFGGQAITMVCSLGLALLFAILNFVYSYAITTPADVLSDKYGASIKCFSTNTRAQYLDSKENANNINYAAIQAHLNDSWTEIKKFDTYEYWLKAEAAAGNKTMSYLDFGKQLSSIYTGFELESNTKDEVAKLTIGSNNAYKYTMDETSHVETQADLNNIPISIFIWEEYQGKYYPCVAVLGGEVGDSLSSWYLKSTLYGLDFSAATVLSSSQWSYTYPGNDVGKLIPTTYNLNKLYTTEAQRTEIKSIYDIYRVKGFSSDFLLTNLKDKESTSGLWEGKFNETTTADRFFATSKILTYFFILGQEEQYSMLKTHTGKDFPYTTAQVVDAYFNLDGFADLTYQLDYAISYGFDVGSIAGKELYCSCNYADAPYCETFNNMYSYSISSLYTTGGLAGVWGSVSLLLFAAATLINRKHDIK